MIRNKLSSKSCVPRVACCATRVDNYRMRIGYVIEAIRNDLGLSQDELADKANTTKSSLSRIEKNKQWPRPETLESIADALGVKVYQIFAAAEGVELPTAPEKHTKGESDVINAYRVMDTDAQVHYRALAKILAEKR